MLRQAAVEAPGPRSRFQEWCHRCEQLPEAAVEALPEAAVEALPEVEVEVEAPELPEEAQLVE